MNGSRPQVEPDGGDRLPVERMSPEDRTQLVKVVTAMFCAGFALNGVIPLFPLYATAFGLSTSQLTLVFAVYGVTLVPALLVIGPLSDGLGRKRILVPAICTFVVASAIFALAQGLWMLIAGRVFQGVANGAMWGTAAAMVRDLMPDARRTDASLLVSVTLTASVAAGAIYFGALGTVTGSFVTPWLGHSVLMVAAAVLIVTTRETHPTAEVAEVRVRVSLPRGHERGFVLFLAPLTFGMSALGGIVMALTPTILGNLPGTAVSAYAGVAVAIFVTVATVVQLLTRGVSAFHASVWGSSVILLGTVLVLLATGTSSLPLLLACLAVMGIGTGLAFRGTLAIAEFMSHAGNRANVLSAYNVVMYTGLSLPALGAGVLVDRIGVGWSLAVASACGLLLIAPASAYGTRRLDPVLRA